MKTFKALYIDNGTIKAGEFPVESDPWRFSSNEEIRIYQQALASAKANAVVVEDQDEAMSFSWYGRVPESKIVPLPAGWDYRVVKKCANCERLNCESMLCRDPHDGSMSYTQVAVLIRTEEQPEPEESQEALWNKAEGIIAEAMGTYKTSLTVALASYARKELEKRFTITRRK